MNSRERLVRAMSELMWERGYAETSPREIRERSGVGQGSMYHHFASKRDLALAAIARSCADILPDAQDPLLAPGDPLATLEAHLTRPRQALKGCKVGRLTQDPLVVSDPGLLAPVADAFARLHDALTAVIAEAVDAGELSPGLDPGHVARTLAATIQGGYVLAIAQQDSRPLEEACAGAVELLRAAAPPTEGTGQGVAASAAGPDRA